MMVVIVIRTTHTNYVLPAAVFYALGYLGTVHTYVQAMPVNA